MEPVYIKLICCFLGKYVILIYLTSQIYNMHGIDLKDRKLIYYLARNSREGFSKLAALIGVSKNSVKYRVDRLKKLGVIDRFLPIINIGFLEWHTFDIFLRLRAN